MNILLVAAEAVPFAKAGGLGDVAGILPKHLKDRGHDLRIVMPRYRQVGLEHETLDTELMVPMGPLGTLRCGVQRGHLPDSKVPIYFIDYEPFFDREGIYTDATGRGYSDNALRYVLLSKAALICCEAIDFQPDVIHCHDWHTGLIPVLLDTHYRNKALGQCASLITIHNMGHQGCFERDLMAVLELDERHFQPQELEFHGQVNLLKGGLVHATLINTVSKHYATEIQSAAFGHGLEGVTQERREDVVGILNGVDYDTWDPSNDPHIAATYDVDDLHGKAVCKQALQQSMGLDLDPNKALFGVVSRLVHQKGIDVLAQTMSQVLQMQLQVVVLGSGEEALEQKLRALAQTHPGTFACRIGYDETLAHQIEAGADFFLMPSRFEPCGLNQLYSLRYGTLPIVHRVGGLHDTVAPYQPEHGTGHGFTFSSLNPDVMADTIGWALHTWRHNRDAINAMQKRAMKLRFSWQHAAAQYESLYINAQRNRRESLEALHNQDAMR